VQVVEVRAPSSGRQQPFTFTFCLERVDVGPYKVQPSPTHIFVTFFFLSPGNKSGSMSGWCQDAQNLLVPLIAGSPPNSLASRLPH